MKQTRHTLCFLLSHYKAIFQHAYKKGIAAPLLLSAAFFALPALSAEICIDETTALDQSSVDISATDENTFLFSHWDMPNGQALSYKNFSAKDAMLVFGSDSSFSTKNKRLNVTFTGNEVNSIEDGDFLALSNAYESPLSVTANDIVISSPNKNTVASFTASNGGATFFTTKSINVTGNNSKIQFTTEGSAANPDALLLIETKTLNATDGATISAEAEPFSRIQICGDTLILDNEALLTTFSAANESNSHLSFVFDNWKVTKDSEIVVTGEADAQNASFIADKTFALDNSAIIVEQPLLLQANKLDLNNSYIFVQGVVFELNTPQFQDIGNGNILLSNEAMLSVTKDNALCDFSKIAFYSNSDIDAMISTENNDIDTPFIFSPDSTLLFKQNATLTNTVSNNEMLITTPDVIKVLGSLSIDAASPSASAQAKIVKTTNGPTAPEIQVSGLSLSSNLGSIFFDGVSLILDSKEPLSTITTDVISNNYIHIRDSWQMPNKTLTLEDNGSLFLGDNNTNHNDDENEDADSLNLALRNTKEGIPAFDSRYYNDIFLNNLVMKSGSTLSFTQYGGEYNNPYYPIVRMYIRNLELNNQEISLSTKADEGVVALAIGDLKNNILRGKLYINNGYTVGLGVKNTEVLFDHKIDTIDTYTGNDKAFLVVNTPITVASGSNIVVGTMPDESIVNSFDSSFVYLSDNGSILFDTTGSFSFEEAGSTLYLDGGNIFVTSDVLTKDYNEFFQGSEFSYVNLQDPDQEPILQTVNGFMTGVFDNEKHFITIKIHPEALEAVSQPLSKTLVTAATQATTKNPLLKEAMNTKEGGSTAERALRLGIYGGAIHTVTKTTDILSHSIAEHALPELSPNQNQLWLEPMYSTTKIRGFSAEGQDYGLDVDMQGLTLGSTFALNDDLLTGFAFSLGSGDTDGKSICDPVENDFDFYALSAFAGYSFEKLTLQADVNYVNVDNDISSKGSEELNASTDSTGLSVGLTAKYHFDVNDVDIDPYIGARVHRLEVKNYTVKGDYNYIHYDAETMTDIVLPVGVSMRTDINAGSWVLTPRLTAEIRAHLNDKDVEANALWLGDNIKTSTKTEVLDSLNYASTLGLSATYNNFSCDVNLNYTGSEHVDSFGVQAEALYRF